MANDNRYPTAEERAAIFRYAEKLAETQDSAAVWGPDLDTGYLETYRHGDNGKLIPLTRIPLRDVLARANDAVDAVQPAGD